MSTTTTTRPTVSSRPTAGHAHRDVEAAETRSQRAFRYVTAAIRISLGWVFLWAFVDKLFGWGYATPGKSAWIHGGSPTLGFLKFGTKGPLANFYQSFAGDTWADWLFMIGLAGIGIALVLGVAMRIATVSGVVMLVMMWSAALLPENNPFMDDHLIYALVLVALALAGAGRTLGLGKVWERIRFVKNHGWLK